MPMILERLRDYVGRESAKQQLRSAAQAILEQPVCQVLYFTAHGGLGKTRMQELLPRILEPDTERHGGSYAPLRISRIVDFYEYKLLSSTLVEEDLINGLIQGAGEDKWYRLTQAERDQAFAAYDQARIALDRGRSAGDRESMQRLSTTARESFITCWNALASRHPLVMRFDTLEMLFSSAAPPEALAHAQGRSSGAARVLQWMQTVLPQLQHTLVIMSGRPSDDVALVSFLHQQKLLRAPVQTLDRFDDDQDIRAYLHEYQLEVDDASLPAIRQLTDGRPLLLACYAETRRDMFGIPPGLPRLGENVKTKAQFEDWLVGTVLDPANPPVPYDPHSPQTTLAWCLYFLVYARRGLTREQMRAMFESISLPYHRETIDNLEHLALIKVLGERLLLHDEIFVMLDESKRVDSLSLRTPTLTFLCSETARAVAAARSYDELVSALGDHVYYELTSDIQRGYRTYLAYVDGLISERYLTAAYVLSDAFWRTMNTRVRRDDEEIYPYHRHLRESRPVLHMADILRAEQVRQLKLLTANAQHEEAEQLADELYSQFTSEGLIPRDGEPLSPRDPYLYVDLTLARANVLLQSRKPGSVEQAEQLFARLIQLLEQNLSGDTFQHSLITDRGKHFLGLAYTRRGQLRRTRHRIAEGIEDAEQARRALRAYLAKPLIQPPTILDWNIANLAQVTNNLAFMLALAGDFRRALALSTQILRDYDQLVPPYRRALFYNTRTLILIRAGEHLEAVGPGQKAQQAAYESGNNRAIGLVTQAQAQLDRYHKNRLHQADPTILLQYERAREFLGSEHSALYDLYYEWSGAARDIGKEYQRQGKLAEAAEMWEVAIARADDGLRQISSEPSMQRADMLERKLASLNLLGRYDEAAQLVGIIEAMMDLPMPRYGQIVSGKLAFQKGLLAIQRDQDIPTALRHGLVTLARVLVFSDNSHDRQTFESLLDEWLTTIASSGKREQLAQFAQDLQSQKLTVQASDLPYQQPDPAIWQAAWQRSVEFFVSGITNALDL